MKWENLAARHQKSDEHANRWVGVGSTADRNEPSTAASSQPVSSPVDWTDRWAGQGRLSSAGDGLQEPREQQQVLEARDEG